MTDIQEHNTGDHEDPLPGPTWTVGVIGVVLLAVSVLAVAALFYERASVEREIKVLSQPTIYLMAVNAEQLAHLEGPVRIESRSEDEDSLVIPLEDAMTLTVREFGSE